MKHLSEYINESLKDVFKKFIGKLSKDTEIKKDNEYNIQIKGSINDNKILLDKKELIEASKKLSEKYDNKNLLFILCKMMHADDVSMPYCYEYKEIKNNEIVLSKIDWNNINKLKDNINNFFNDIDDVKEDNLYIEIKEKDSYFNNVNVVLERYNMNDYIAILISYYI